MGERDLVIDSGRNASLPTMPPLYSFQARTGIYPAPVIVSRRGVLAFVLLLAACGTNDAVTNAPSAVAAEDRRSLDIDTSTVTAPTVSVPTAVPVVEVAPSPIPTTEDAPAVLPTPTETSIEQASPPPESDCLRLTNFTTEAENLDWFVVNDNVMGGRSNGGPSFVDGAMIFEGDINTNGGGFSSVRVQLTPTALTGYTQLRVRARTDGRPYKVTLEDALEVRDRRVSQQGSLIFGDADTDGWRLAEVEFADLNPRIFGRDVASEPFRPDLADQLGIMLSDNVDGPFRLEIDWIDLCR